MNKKDAMIYRLRAEVIAAEAELNEANTATTLRRCLKRYEQALDRYSDLALRPVANVSASSSNHEVR